MIFNKERYDYFYNTKGATCNLPLLKKIKLNYTERDYLIRSNIGNSDLYTQNNIVGFTEYDILKLQNMLYEFKKCDSIRDILYPDIQEVLQNILTKIESEDNVCINCIK